VPDDEADDNIAEWDAAYMLGALSTEDQRTYENYLAANPDDAAALRQLDDMPAILSALSRDEAVALTDIVDAKREPPTGVVLLARAAAERQRRSRRMFIATAVGIAAALAVVGGVVGATVFPRTATVQTAAMAPMQPGARAGLTAQLAITEKKWGTELNWACQYTKGWARGVASYDIVVTTTDGVQTTVGSWKPAGDDATGLSAATSIPASAIRSVDIRVSGTNQPLAITTL
jgi:hypothetical protein